MKPTIIVLSLILIVASFAGSVIGDETPASSTTVAACCEDQLTGNIVRINMSTVKGGEEIKVRQGDFVVFTSSGDDEIRFKKDESASLFGAAAKVVVVKASKCTWVRVQCFAEPGTHEFDSRLHPSKQPLGGPTIVVCKPGQPC